jgi:hypothetical protein
MIGLCVATPFLYWYFALNLTNHQRLTGVCGLRQLKLGFISCLRCCFPWVRYRCSIRVLYGLISKHARLVELASSINIFQLHENKVDLGV